MKKTGIAIGLIFCFLMFLFFSCRFDEDVFPDVPFPQSEKLVEYDGKIYNIFFHPLLIYPQFAFDNDRYHAWLADWFVTYTEAKSMIEDLYAGGYVLVGLNDVIEESDDPDTGLHVFKKRKLMLPEGRRPLLLSIDDLNFYKSTVHNGTASSLFVDDDGRLSEMVYNGDKKQVMRGRTIITLIDEFVDRHPDFSFSGYKGLIALTGKEGILGYRTSQGKKEISAAEKAVEYLKAEGWEFASHTYAHINIRNTDVSKVENDDLKWKNEVASITGKTRHLVYPFGSWPAETGAQFQYYLKSGYSFFWSVGNGQELRIEKNYIILNRMGADGKCVTGKYGDVSELFDIRKAVDPMRMDSKYHGTAVAVKEDGPDSQNSPAVN